MALHETWLQDKFISCVRVRIYVIALFLSTQQTPAAQDPLSLRRLPKLELSEEATRLCYGQHHGARS
ncbi:hypothetical protein R1flu_011624 [Riccia fluitans]|uniref:Uncharacterized protein n=1 Tax=Riccia fluitans TaxID=41844 RepID=A0ABD1Z8B6_9MARC